MKKIQCLLGLAVAVIAAAAPAQAADETHYKIIDRIKVADGSFDYASFDAVTGRVYMPRGDFTTVIDVKTGAATELRSAAGDHIALPLPGTSLLLLTQRAGAIRLVDAAADRVVAELQGEKNPNSAVYDPVTRLAFVLNKDSGTATIVDPASRSALGTVPISRNTLEFPATDGVGNIFVNIETTGEIVVLDTRRRLVTGSFKLTDCEEPSGLAYAADAKLLIAACHNGIAKIIRADTGKAVAAVPIGSGPDAVIYDPVRKLAFVPCGQDGVLEVISLADPAHIGLVQTVQTQTGSRTGAVDPSTGRIYLMASKPDSAASRPAGGRGVPRLAGSWEVLVVAP